MKYFEKKAISENEEYKKKLKKWNFIFKNIYGDDIDENLFLRHTYFALLLKVLISTKLSIIQNLDLEDAYLDCISNNLKSLQIPEFDYYNWTNLNKKIFKKIYIRVENVEFGQEDLFQEIYQQIIFAITRHKIGEFYTPKNLVKIMIDELYEFGLKILDPSCGSGSFLVNIIIKILQSNKPNSLKTIAINNVYGIDINPLATITAKINIFLLFLEHFDFDKDIIPNIKIYLFDSLFPKKYENQMMFNLKDLYNSFDLIIGNPPWLTYKDLTSKDYQISIRELSEELGIKPLSQYITHIELAAVFFYAIPTKYLKIGGKIFFVITKSVLSGDHCYKFRAFAPFQNLEIWDFPNYYFFKVDHICLKADYIGIESNTQIEDKYPIKTKIYNDDLELINENLYSTLKIGSDGARIIRPVDELSVLSKVSYSPYRSKFFQGATLVPRSLIFFQIEKKDDNKLVISSDPDIMSRAKKNWRYYFQNKEVERNFHFKTFLNKDLIPFFLKISRNVFLPVNENFEFSMEHLQEYPKALNFYNEMNGIYKDKKKATSDILTLFSNLNYWNKLTKQSKNLTYLVIYNASGAKLKAAVINNSKKNIIIGSENYYYSTDSKEEVYYLAGILNSLIFSKNIKLIKSSRHIHKRPFSFPIPLYDENNEDHKTLAKKAIKCETIAQDLFMKNPNINSEKVRTIINQKLLRINDLVEKVVFT